MSAAWSGDLVVTEAVAEIVDPENPENDAPARIVAVSPDPNLIIEVSPWLAASLTFTAVMKPGVPLPATVGQTLVIRSRVT